MITPPGPRAFKPGLRALALSGVAFILLATSGCVYLRLLQVRDQLREMDKYFSMLGEDELVIQFNEPVLLNRDAEYLIGGEPMTKTGPRENRTWYYEFEMVRNESLPPVPLGKLTLHLTMADGKLAQIIVPPEFLRLFPRKLLIETLRRAPGGAVEKLRKTVRAWMQMDPDVEALFPSRDKTVQLLGEPLETTPGDDHTVWYLYRYRIIKGPDEVEILAHLNFFSDGRLRRIIVKWDTSTIDVEYLRKW